MPTRQFLFPQRLKKESSCRLIFPVMIRQEITQRRNLTFGVREPFVAGSSGQPLGSIPVPSVCSARKSRFRPILARSLVTIRCEKRMLCQGDGLRAIMLFITAHALREGMGAPLPPVNPAAYNSDIAAVPNRAFCSVLSYQLWRPRRDSNPHLF